MKFDINNILTNSLSILVYFFLVFLVQGVLFYTYLVPQIKERLNTNIINTLNDNRDLKIVMGYIFKSSYDNLFQKTYNENNDINKSNTTTTIIYSSLVVVLLLIIIGVIFYAKTRLQYHNLNITYIFISVVITLLFITLYELGITSLIYTDYSDNNYSFISDVLNIFHARYNNPALNYSISDVNRYNVNIVNSSIVQPTAAPTAAPIAAPIAAPTTTRSTAI